MRLLSLTCDDNELPDSVSVEMSIQEAAFLAKLLGKQTDAECCKVMAGGHRLHHSVNDCLTGAIFNRFWDSGVDGFKE